MNCRWGVVFFAGCIGWLPGAGNPARAGDGAGTARTAVVTVAADSPGPRLNPLIFGNNMLDYQNRRREYSDWGAGIWDAEHRRPEPHFLAAARAAGITICRWPGGCASHNYNWKRTVGPLRRRPHMLFGLPEFLRFCEALHAQAILTVAAYWGGPGDAADLVEYLNAPADGSNPNGGTDWAAVRAADGHPKPFHVVYFEYGNESYHGEHHPTGGRKKKRVLTPERYAANYLAYRAAMRAVDPRIRLGAVIQSGRERWDRAVLKIAGKKIDFCIDHTYRPGYWGKGNEKLSDAVRRPFMEACAACEPFLQQEYDRLNAMVREITGRNDLHFAITEYNAGFVQERPVPFRQSLGAALRNALEIGVLMRPENQILNAEFWQFANEYWGMVRGYPQKGERLVKQANQLMFELYARHFGGRRLRSRVTCRHWDYPGSAILPPRRGKPEPFHYLGPNLLPDSYQWKIRETPYVTQTASGPVLKAKFLGRDANYYHAAVELPAQPNTWYRLVGRIKTAGLEAPRGAGFQVGDARGWTATHSAAVRGDVRGTTGWTPVEVDYFTLPDTRRITISARRLGEDRRPPPGAAGTAWYRLVSVRAFAPRNFGAVPDIYAFASRREDGAAGIILINTNPDRSVQVAVRGLGPAGRVEAECLRGKHMWSTNLKEREVWLEKPEIRVGASGVQVMLPAFSMAGVTIESP